MPNGFMDYMMPLIGMEEGLGPGDFVFDLDPATPEKGLPTTTQYLANVYCGQTAGWMKMPLGTKVDHGPSHMATIDTGRKLGGCAPLGGSWVII